MITKAYVVDIGCEYELINGVWQITYKCPQCGGPSDWPQECSKCEDPLGGDGIDD